MKITSYEGGPQKPATEEMKAEARKYAQDNAKEPAAAQARKATNAHFNTYDFQKNPPSPSERATFYEHQYERALDEEEGLLYNNKLKELTGAVEE